MAFKYNQLKFIFSTNNFNQKRHPFYLSDNEPLRFAPALKRSRALAEVPAFRHSFCELLISLLGRDFQKQRKDKK